MKKMFYPRLAKSGISRNRRLYVPYILSCIGTIMMSYILQEISESPLLNEMKGGGSLGTILSLGKFVILAFSVIFLLYTNSFLTKRRYKEFGLYSILGMDRRSIARIVLWESLIVAGISLGLGLFAGIAFSKLAELGLINFLKQKADYGFYISIGGIIYTVRNYVCIFALLMLKSVIQIRRSRPLELLHSQNYGERPPKANWIPALLGLAILAAAYSMALSITQPMQMLMMFFVAVLMVILATYLLFMSGSVVLCRILRRSKRYYYKKQHFVSVSSMAFRMKRNGAGLASICILATMVLVMISSSSSLYFGKDESIRSSYPNENAFSVFLREPENMDPAKTDRIAEHFNQALDAHQVTPLNMRTYHYADNNCYLNDDCLQCSTYDYVNTLDSDNMRYCVLIPLSEYNLLQGTDYTLEKDEVLLYTNRCKYSRDHLTIEGQEKITFRIQKQLQDTFILSDAQTNILPSMILIVSDIETMRPLLRNEETGESQTLFNGLFYYGYDLDCDDNLKIQIYEEQLDLIPSIASFFSPDSGFGYSASCASLAKIDFLATYGGLFFLGIVLSILFICAAAVIIYYKQISEGYEDHERFEIMQKVGMTDADIRKSINSQVLTVFFAPLLGAGVHLCFAFPMVWRMLQLFGLVNMNVVILVTVISFVIFGIFYGLIYKATARTYYHIVSA